MGRFVLARLVQLIPVLLGISAVSFSLLSLTPGDPAEIYLRMSMQQVTPEAVARLHEAWGLDDPLPVRYWRWLGDAVRMDLGESMRTGRPVADELLRALPATARLASVALLFALALSLPLGVVSAASRGPWWDGVTRLAALAGAAFPNFWFGLILIYVFSVRLGWLPAMGAGGWRHTVLPAATLSFGMAAACARLLRASLLEVLDRDYIRTARAKGLSAGRIVWVHALRNALIPFITEFGMSLAHLLGGAVVVESIFAWPGIGKFAWESIMARDYAAVQGFVLFLSTAFVLASLLVDIAYGFLDPRIRYDA